MHKDVCSCVTIKRAGYQLKKWVISSIVGKITHIQFYLLVLPVNILLILAKLFLKTFLIPPHDNVIHVFHNSLCIPLLYVWIHYILFVYITVLFVSTFFGCTGSSMKERSMHYRRGLLHSLVGCVRCTRAPHLKRCCKYGYHRLVYLWCMIVKYLAERVVNFPILKVSGTWELLKHICTNELTKNWMNN